MRYSESPWHPNAIRTATPDTVEYGAPDGCVCSMSHCLGFRAVRSIGRGMVPLSWRHEPVFRVYFSGQQRQS